MRIKALYLIKNHLSNDLRWNEIIIPVEFETN